MKRREQALLLLRKAGQDEALLDEILASESVDDEVIGFHCQTSGGKDSQGAAFRSRRQVSQDP